MRKHNFLKAVATALCMALLISGTAFAATPGQALDSKEVKYGTISRADQNILKSMFNAEEYAAMNEDVANIIGKDANKLFAHFIKYGLFEGRGPSKSFNVSAYMSSYGDLQKVFGNDIMAYYRHYVNYGMKEKRELVTVEKAEAAGVVIKSVTGAAKTVLTPAQEAAQKPASGGSASSSSGSSSPVHAPVLNVTPAGGITTLDETDTTGITISVTWPADVSGNTIAWVLDNSAQSSLVTLSNATAATVTVAAADALDTKIDTDTTIAISVTVDGTYTSHIDITMVNEGAAALSNECAITAFSFQGLSPAVTGTISGTNITLTVPNGTDVSNLVATFTASAGATVKVGSDAQTSGTTANNFTSPVSYVVTAEDTTTTQTYTVSVTVAPAAHSYAISGGNTVTIPSTLTLSLTDGGSAAAGTVTWEVANGTGSATIDSSSGVLTPTAAGAVTVTAKVDGTAVISDYTVTITAGTISISTLDTHTYDSTDADNTKNITLVATPNDVTWTLETAAGATLTGATLDVSGCVDGAQVTVKASKAGYTDETLTITITVQ